MDRLLIKCPVMISFTILLIASLLYFTAQDAQAQTFLSRWGSLGGLNGQFEIPIGIAVDRSGFLYALDWFGCSVQKFDLEWSFLYLPLLMK
jgi:hypothetical protein